jgi:6-phosphogluconolactonase (cycloisomerase 2 family)
VNVTAKNQVAAFAITPATGALALAGSPIATGAFPVSIAIDPSGQWAYVANDNSNDISVYAVDATTGALTQASHSPFAAGNEPRSIAID